MKNIIPLIQRKQEEEQSEQQAKIIKFPSIHQLRKQQARQPRKAKLSAHYLYYRNKKIPISQFEKAGYGKLLRLIVKEIS